MLYLIGGSPRCGKTTFSRMLAKKKRIPWFSTDLVATIVYPYFSDKERENELPSLNVCTMSPELLLNAEIQNAKTLWPGIKRLLFSLMKLKYDAVIEGVHLFPEFLHEFETMKEWKLMRHEMRIVYLIKKDEQKIIDGFKKVTSYLTGCSSAYRPRVIWKMRQKWYRRRVSISKNRRKSMDTKLSIRSMISKKRFDSC